MRSIYKVVISLLTALAGIALAIAYFHGKNFELLNTAGQIGDKQRNLMLFTVVLSLVIVVPVLALTFYITWKYRSTNPKARYTPDWDGSKTLETIWWLIPLAIIVVLAVVTWNTSHSLDPRKPIASDQTPIKIQVVALEWKWLFIYPDKHIATVNYLMMPEKRPVEFSITAEAPMNSFSIPQLGGQIYAMTGMSNKLNLMADRTGTFRGQSTNLSGEGFADMTFNAYSVSQQDYDNWADHVITGSKELDYASLAKQSRGDTPMTYSVAKQPMLYTTIVDKYMMMDHNHSEHEDHNEGEE